MKKCLSLLMIFILATSVCFTGCNPVSNNTTETTQATENKLKPADSHDMLADYFNDKLEGDNPFYGVWEIEGISYISFAFRNDGLAEMIMGSEGNFTQLKIDEKKKTFEVSFLVGLTGTYNYKFSKDKETITLTQKNAKTVLKKVKNFDIVPEAPEKAKIDKKLAGWWKSDSGLVYYFGNDGIMYSNSIIFETFYTYETENGMIHSVYDYNGDVKDSFGYKFTKKGKLKIKDNIYSPYNPFE